MRAWRMAHGAWQTTLEVKFPADTHWPPR